MSSLRVAISGGASIPAPVLDAFEERFGVLILEGYGLTETASTTTFNMQRRPSAAPTASASRSGAPQTQVWDDDGSALPPGKDNVGEVVTRGLHVMKGYLHNPEATAEAFAGGWFHTGDLGYFDEDGFLFIVGRKKELIIRGGYNVYPREIEDVLHAHPAVAEAAVIGVPDDAARRGGHGRRHAAARRARSPAPELHRVLPGAARRLQVPARSSSSATSCRRTPSARC